MIQKNTVKELGDRLTVDSLRYYVPIFQNADDSYERLILLVPDELSLKVRV